MKSFSTYFNNHDLFTERVGVGIEGIEYEKRVLKVMKQVEAAVPDLKVKTAALQETEADAVTGFYSHGNDLEIEFHGIKTAIELKKDAEAQMGGSSINYDMTDKELFIEGSKNISKTIADHVLNEYSKKVNMLNTLLDFLRKQEPVEYHEKINGFPLRCTKEAWTKAVDNNLTKGLISKIRSDISFIVEHYAAKGVDYIQVGKLGLFYLQNNPLNLPVPKLTGEIDIEVRPVRSGSVMSTKIGEKVASVLLRMQGRLKFNTKSNYTLDNFDSAKELFKAKVEVIKADDEDTVVSEAAKCEGPTQKTSSDRPDKKWMQCVKDEETGEYKRVHWGQPGVTVSGKRNTARRKSFRARHKCDTNPPKKGTPRYQACKDW